MKMTTLLFHSWRTLTTSLQCLMKRQSHFNRLFLGFISVCVLIVMLAASPAAFAQTVRFVVTCDSRGSDNGVNTAILSEIVQAFLDEEVDFVLFPGDLITGSFDQSTNELQFTNWLSIMQPLYDVGIGVYPCRGNHDVYSPKTAWDNVFTGSYSLPNNGPSGEENVTFSFTYQNVFVVGLDQYVVDGRVNQTWLDAQFANNTEPHIFVFGHEPAFKLVHEDCLDDYPENRDTFWDSIADAGGRAYFAGHDHFYDHSRLDDGDANPDNDLHQYIVGDLDAYTHHARAGVRLCSRRD